MAKAARVIIKVILAKVIIINYRLLEVEVIIKQP